MRVKTSGNTVLVVLLSILITAYFFVPFLAEAQSSNLIPNPGFETAGTGGVPQGWIKGRWGTNTAVFTYPAAGRSDTKGVKVELVSHTSGDAKWAHGYVPATPGEQYTYSDYYLATIPSHITVEFKKSDGSFSYLDIAQAPSRSSFGQISARFVAPAGVQTMRVFHLIKQPGSLTVDDVALVSDGIPADPTKFDKGYVTINFDDGWRSSYDIALPRLDAKGFTSTHCISTGYLSDNYPGYIKPAEVLDIEARGHEICAHSQSHSDLTAMPPAQAEGEISGSRDVLLDLGASPVSTFGYPFGAYNSTVKQLVRDAGFIGARSSDGGYNRKNGDRYALARRPMVNTTTLAQAKGYIDEAIANKGWVVLLFHRVDQSGSTYSVSPALFGQVLDYLQAQGIAPITLSEGFSKMSP